jgi:negative regulator of sigma E activity
MKIDEMLSAALDGECTSEELDQLIAAVGSDPAAMQRWQSWSAVKASLDGVRVGRVSADWSNAVMKSIAMEPAPVMAAPATRALPERGVRVVQTPRRRRRSTWAAAGAAASLSAVALGWMLVGNQAAVSESPGPAFSPTVNGTPAQVVQAGLSRVVREAPEARANTWLINDYLMEHHQLAGSQGMGSTLRQAQFDVLASNYSPEESLP